MLGKCKLLDLKHYGLQIFRSGRLSNINNLFYILMVVIFLAGGAGCASKKNLTKAPTEDTSENAKKIAQAKEDLLRIINDDGSMSTKDMQQKVNDVRSQNLNDAEVNDLLIQAQMKIDQINKANQQQAKEQQQQAATDKMTEEALQRELNDIFNKIAAAPSDAEADRYIEKYLNLFDSSNTPVLIIVYQDGSTVDYDRPTTILEYMQYLKDQKKSLNEINSIQFNPDRIITELELIKKQ